VTGPHTQNFHEIVQTFSEANALVQLAQLPEAEMIERIAKVFAELLNDQETRTRWVSERDNSSTRIAARRFARFGSSKTSSIEPRRTSGRTSLSLREARNPRELDSCDDTCPLSALYGAGVQLRRTLYRREFLRSFTLPAPVISVGNITTGGTGKTPLVAFIARAVAARGQKVGVLTRDMDGRTPLDAFWF